MLVHLRCHYSPELTVLQGNGSKLHTDVPAAFNKLCVCVGVFLRLSVVRIKNLILKPPRDPLNLPRSEAMTQHSGMTQTFRATDT